MKKLGHEIVEKGFFYSVNVRIESDIRERKESKEIPAQQSGDMYTELKKLKELLDTGVITQSEFETQKTRILNK